MKYKTLLLTFLNIIILLNCVQQNDKIDSSKIIRFGSLIGLKPEYEERYIILHKYTFPGVLNRIRKCNIRNYSIFLKDGLLFSHFEYIGSDFNTDMAAMADDTTKDWWKLTDPMQIPLENRKEGEWWASMVLYFQMDTGKVSFESTKRFAYTGFIDEGQEQSFIEELQKLGKSFQQVVLDANIQNVTIYGRDNQIFLYYEYVSEDLGGDMEHLQQLAEFQKLNTGLKKVMNETSVGFANHYWYEMKEVFHTN